MDGSPFGLACQAESPDEGALLVSVGSNLGVVGFAIDESRFMWSNTTMRSCHVVPLPCYQILAPLPMV
jgi:hypothetical protein